ncbi:Serine/threonine-protein phosphatase PP1 isozyme 2 [Dissostichus eleginoides]|uniref:Serine/threonine-protein phosphatase PP1 isozyme 2 n=1 Tax=Dissostichus eleginoides TaxID=100907 RepID=A0AAD9C7H7_DISEL|nr:Serine/threonine-protein phosphatase PP1 isozyme 2 [Dissostichus eleginoides]
MSGFEEWAADYRASKQGSAQILFLAGLLEWLCMLSVKEAAREGVWELESDMMLVFLHSQRGDILELFGLIKGKDFQFQLTSKGQE